VEIDHPLTTDASDIPPHPAYNWHPLVHKSYFGETLYFIMLRLKEPLHRPVAEQIRDLLAAVDVRYACEYSLLGTWDAFIRTWMTPYTYERFAASLRSHNVDDLRGFTTTSLHYLWHEPVDLLSQNREILSKIQGATDHIARVARDPHHTHSESWQHLHGLGLVFPNKSLAEGVKFYTCLTRTSDELSPERTRSMIIETIEKTALPRSGEPMIHRTTLYTGSGDLGHYLVRCEADYFTDVLPLVESFDIYLKDTQLHPVTLLVPNSRPREYDHANNWLHLTQDDDDIAAILDVDREKVARLDDEHRSALGRLVRKACALPHTADDELREILLDILRATVADAESDPHRQLHIALSYLGQYEPLFRTRLETELIAAFGHGWREIIKTYCEANEKWHRQGREMTKEKWTLGTYKFTAIVASKIKPAFRGRLQTQFGSDWAQKTEDLEALRNGWAHGYVYTLGPLAVYDAPLPDEADQTLAAYYGRLFEAALFWRRFSAPAVTTDIGLTT
jgi:hypothetical protein